MAGFLAAWQLVLQRSIAHWRLLGGVAVGMILAIALMSSAVLYGDALKELGLRYALGKETQENLDIQLIGYYLPIQVSQYQRIRTAIEKSTQDNLGWLLKGTSRATEGSTFLISDVARLKPSDKSVVRTFFYSIAELETHINLVEGSFPSPVILPSNVQDPPDPPPIIGVLISEEAAKTFGLSIGDKVTFSPYWEERLKKASITVAGIIKAKNPQEEFWLGRANVFGVTYRGEDTLTLFVSEDTLFQGAGRLFPRMLADYAWLLYVDPSRINATNGDAALAGVSKLREDLGRVLPSSKRATVLEQALTDYKTRLFFTGVPLYLLIVQVVGIVLYYMVMVGTILVERQLGEIGLLRSRGATVAQVIAIYLMEGLLIAIVGVSVGPLIAAFGIASLGKFPPLESVTGGNFLPMIISSRAYLMGLLGGVLGLIAMVVPAYRGSQEGVIEYKRAVSRPQGLGWYHRYYLDVFFVIVGGIVYWEVTQRGGLVGGKVLGGITVDQLLLVGPAVLVVGVSLVFLRIFPLLLRLIGSLLGDRLGVSGALALWQMGRDPGHYGRLVLLLMLGASLGVFAASFSGTLDRSYKERALYASGSDIRLIGLPELRVGGSPRPEREYASLTGAKTTSLVLRAPASILSAGFGQSVTAMAVDPKTFGQVAWFRGDFSSGGLDRVLQPLEADESSQEQGIPLPQAAHKLGIWVQPASAQRNIFLSVRIKDSRGRFYSYPLGELNFQEWRYLETDLLQPPRGRFGTLRNFTPPQSPIYLQSLYIQFFGSPNQDMPSGAVYVDDLQAALSADGQSVVMDGFEELKGWETIVEMPNTPKDTIQLTKNPVHSGMSAGMFTWSGGLPLPLRGTFRESNPTPLAAIASRSLLTSQGYKLGDRILLGVHSHLVPITIQGVVDFFPTLDPEEEPFLILNVNRLEHYLNIVDNTPRVFSDEIWMKTTSIEAERAQLLQAIESRNLKVGKIYDSRALLAASQADPLVAAGWSGILFVTFGSITLLSLLGLSIYLYATGQRRRIEYAVLRSLGVSFRQISIMVWLEHTFVVGVGIIVGMFLGIRLGAVLMPMLGITEGGARVLPPFVIQVNWSAIFGAYFLMGLTFIAALFLLTVALVRLGISRLLRIGEEM